MKRTSCMAIIAAAALAVCGCQDNLNSESGLTQDGAIAFNPSVGGIQNAGATKAGDLRSADGGLEIPVWLEVSEGIAGQEASPATKGEQLNTTGSDKALSTYAAQIGNVFYVSGWMGATRFMPAADATDPYETVGYASGKWTAASTYSKWSESDDIRTFYAYANLPVKETGVVDASVTCTSNAEQTLTYSVVPAAAGLQNDILLGYGCCAPKEVSTTDKVSTADVTFYHPLTAVRFKMGEIPGSNIKFKAFYISEVYKSGTTTVNPVEIVAPDCGDKFTWTDLSTEMQEATQEFSSDGISVSEGDIIGEPFIIIPQNLEDNPVTVTVVVDIDGVTQPLSFIADSGEWEAGKTYTYTISKVGPSSYHFTFNGVSKVTDSRTFAEIIQEEEILPVYSTRTDAATTPAR